MTGTGGDTVGQVFLNGDEKCQLDDPSLVELDQRRRKERWSE